MLHKLNTTLLIIFIVGLVGTACYVGYYKLVPSIKSSSIITQMGGE